MLGGLNCPPLGRGTAAVRALVLLTIDVLGGIFYFPPPQQTLCHGGSHHLSDPHTSIYAFSATQAPTYQPWVP